MARTFLNSRIALAVALSSGLIFTAASPALAAKKEAKPAGPDFSDGFRKAAGPLQAAMDAGTKSVSGVPAGNEAARDAAYASAKQAIDTALGGNAKAAFDAAAPAATTPDDKNALGTLMRNYGIISKDLAFKQKGNLMQLESGKAAPDQIGLMNFDAGVTAYQLADYPTAAKYLMAAKAAGYHDSNNQIDAIIADTYRKSGNTQGLLQMAQADIAAAKAKGTAPSEEALRNALQQTYSAKQVGPSTEYAAMLARYYPSAWNTSISVVRQMTSLPREQNLDLMRLMFLTGAMKDKNDYLEYIDNLDPRAYPGEALKVMDDGIAKGKLSNADLGADRSTASGRISGDKASLPSTERDANKPGATAASVMGAGDVFMSYEQPAKAEGFYAKALGLPGVDANKAALRLGMAQVQQGKYAEAQASFAKVSGTRAPVAQLWNAYAQSKASPAG
ncbi:hypothetical protein WSK_1121 [Novosphingobium sp. Rr 2-17]|uniref:hypothetical protein n=1 Tax=Novosphingobium sp. Rr 2-17 TaxID=555793 RepID=UPI000269A4B3|nr:hypothetical protein [Novosphingobium sp. Rr 2-17]EIZ80328.1 hypothetical protein WSK_1121 [Novosphingobium sp. Rr 2-17]